MNSLNFVIDVPERQHDEVRYAISECGLGSRQHVLGAPQKGFTQLCQNCARIQHFHIIRISF